MASRNKKTKKALEDELKGIALSHSQVASARQSQANVQGTTQAVLDMYDNQLRELELKGMEIVKQWFGIDGYSGNSGNGRTGGDGRPSGNDGKGV